jgi:hypothetical protein
MQLKCLAGAHAMQASHLPRPSLWSLLSCWLTLSGLIFRSCGRRLREILDRGQDTVKDAILDLEVGREAPDERSSLPATLPPVDGRQLARILREHYEEALRQVAEVINEDPYGCLSEVTEDRVFKLMKDLGQEALQQAFEMQVQTAETQLPASQVPQGEWAKRFRRMLAAEGRWPHPSGANDVSSQLTLFFEPSAGAGTSRGIQGKRHE